EIDNAWETHGPRQRNLTLYTDVASRKAGSGAGLTYSQNDGSQTNQSIHKLSTSFIIGKGWYTAKEESIKAYLDQLRTPGQRYPSRGHQGKVHPSAIEGLSVRDI
ncbi:hypothetical protein Tco_0305817, partial [Tanacetum coccineum]